MNWRRFLGHLLPSVFMYTVVRLLGSSGHPYGWIGAVVDIIGCATLVAMNFFIYRRMALEYQWVDIVSELAEIERIAKEIKQKEPEDLLF